MLGLSSTAAKGETDTTVALTPNKEKQSVFNCSKK